MNYPGTNKINRQNITEIIDKMSHDMRTPLTSVGGFAEMLLEDDSITGESREYLQIILDESAKMAEILTKFMSDIDHYCDNTE